jgi:hypothetical protein
MGSITGVSTRDSRERIEFVSKIGSSNKTGIYEHTRFPSDVTVTAEDTRTPEDFEEQASDRL